MVVYLYTSTLFNPFKLPKLSVILFVCSHINMHMNVGMCTHIDTQMHYICSLIRCWAVPSQFHHLCLVMLI